MSKVRVEKLKQGVSSNNDVLVFRNDLGQYQGQSNVVLTQATLSTGLYVASSNAVVNSSAVYTNSVLLNQSPTG